MQKAKIKSTIKYCYNKVTTIPPHILTKKIVCKIYRKIQVRRNRINDLNQSTRIRIDLALIKRSFINKNQLNLSGISKEVARYLSEMYISHRFDLLGSGWVKNHYNLEPLGVEGFKYNSNVKITNFDKTGDWIEKIVLTPHVKSSKNIWELIDSDEYEPIDWQRDFKSGYRWDLKRWYLEQSYGHESGVDIKVPWELSRFQHLPQMAIFALILPEYKDRLILEFKNQVLDFIATNPPRMGANWVCPMDVAIRASNMLVAYDMFLQLDESNIISDEFKQVFTNSIYEHGLHIVNNLEYSKILTSNHYLSDIAGLVFISSYLERSKEIDNWLAFGIQEFIGEINKQFYKDGSNFEASTSYHRLSGELFIYTTVLILGLDEDKKQALKDYNYKNWKIIPKLKPREEQEYNLNAESLFPGWFIEKLYKSVLFTADLTKPTGEIPQIGDNDSGRFFRLSPVGEFITIEKAINKYKNLSGYKNGTETIFWDENMLNHLSFIASVDGIFDKNIFTNLTAQYPLEYSFVSTLAKNKKIIVKDVSRQQLDRNNQITISQELKYKEQTVIESHENKDQSLKENIKCYSYPDSGIYIFTSNRIHLTVSAGPNGQCGNGGHAHNDKLSFELNIDGKDIIVDPGTYLYTPLADRRNLFRCTKNHNTMFIDDMEQNTWLAGATGLFNLKDEAKCEVLSLNSSKIAIKLTYRKVCQIRIIEIQDKKIIVDDYSNQPFKVNLNRFNLYSNGYGKLINV